jgi:hypothetical protein
MFFQFNFFLLIFHSSSFQHNALNDSHAQLMVHWLGEGSDVMICLARDPPLGPNDDPNTTITAPSTSEFYFYFGPS